MRNVHYLIAEPLKRGQLEMKRHNEKLYSEVQNSFLNNWWSTQETEQCYPTLQSSANAECSWKPQLKAWVPGRRYWGCCEPPEGRTFGTSLDPWGDTSEGNNGTLANFFFSFASWCCDEQFVPANTPCRCYQRAYQRPKATSPPNLGMEPLELRTNAKQKNQNQLPLPIYWLPQFSHCSDRKLTNLTSKHGVD